MKKNLDEQYVRYALEYLDENPDCISKDTKNLAVSFGPDVISIGLLPAIVSYEGSVRRGQDAEKIMKAILGMLKKDAHSHAAGFSSLRAYVLGNTLDAYRKKERIFAAATALKVALRTYPQANEKQSEPAQTEGDEKQ